MKIDIRKNIINNFTDSDIDEISTSIKASIEEKEEVTLPGLGVFFELLWNNSTEDEQLFILNTIKKGLNEKPII
ncbi:MAG: small acid-soluble spore protein SspI [Bacilli bacterium]|nr:small acid-soluble spore protein SspI [Bacilli bacterium]MDD4808628.1 small acid-soluble spore protein SspI [Bacilli bacterium]